MTQIDVIRTGRTGIEASGQRGVPQTAARGQTRAIPSGRSARGIGGDWTRGGAPNWRASSTCGFIQHFFRTAPMWSSPFVFGTVLVLVSCTILLPPLAPPWPQLMAVALTFAVMGGILALLARQLHADLLDAARGGPR